MRNCIITPKYLKEFSPIPLNFNTTEIENYVKLAEDKWIKPIVGDRFYYILLDQVMKNEITEENGTLLLEAIYPLLGFAVAYEALPLLWGHISEVGITKGKSDNSESLTLRDMTYVQNHLLNQVEMRRKYCEKWICERIEHFPYMKVGGPKTKNKIREIYGTPRAFTDLK